MRIKNMNETAEVKSNKKRNISIIVIFILICFGGCSYSFISYIQKKAGMGIYDNYDKMEPTIFTISEYDKIEECYKKGIYKLFHDNEYFDGSYFLTKIPGRAKKVIAYGNFSNKKGSEYTDKDIAFVIEKNDFRSSSVYIMSASGDLLFFEEFDGELPTISSFKKGAKIFMNKEVLEKAPSDGVMIYFKNSKKALLYLPEKKVFEEFYQYTQEDLDSRGDETESEGDYTEESDSVVNKVIVPSNVVKDTTAVK